MPRSESSAHGSCVTDRNMHRIGSLRRAALGSMSGSPVVASTDMFTAGEAFNDLLFCADAGLPLLTSPDRVCSGAASERDAPAWPSWQHTPCQSRRMTSQHAVDQRACQAQDPSDRVSVACSKSARSACSRDGTERTHADAGCLGVCGNLYPGGQGASACNTLQRSLSSRSDHDVAGYARVAYLNCAN